MFLIFLLTFLSVCFLVFLNPGDLNDIHVCSKTLELEVGQILQYKDLQNSYKAKGEARW